MFEGALERGTTARIRERVLEQCAAERRIGHGTRNASVEPDDDVNQWVAFLPNKGRVFRTLINNARALETVRFIKLRARGPVAFVHSVSQQPACLDSPLALRTRVSGHPSASWREDPPRRHALQISSRSSDKGFRSATLKRPS